MIHNLNYEHYNMIKYKLYTLGFLLGINWIYKYPYSDLSNKICYREMQSSTSDCACRDHCTTKALRPTVHVAITVQWRLYDRLCMSRSLYNEGSVLCIVFYWCLSGRFSYFKYEYFQGNSVWHVSSDNGF